MAKSGNENKNIGDLTSGEPVPYITVCFEGKHYEW